MSFSEEAQNFKNKMNRIFEEIWETSPFTLKRMTDDDYNLFTPARVPLFKKGNEDSIFGLFEYDLGYDSIRQRFLTKKSSLTIYPSEDESPLFTYGFDRSHETTPRAHLKIHSEDRGLSRIDFPLGGDILRPCLEDVILSCDNNFSIGISKEDREFLKIRVKEFRDNQKDLARYEWEEAVNL